MISDVDLKAEEKPSMGDSEERVCQTESIASAKVGGQPGKGVGHVRETERDERDGAAEIKAEKDQK